MKQNPTFVELLTDCVTKQAANSNHKTFCKLLWTLNRTLKTAVPLESQALQQSDTRTPSSYLKWFIEEGFHSLGQASDQSKRVSQNIQTQDKNIHLLEELQQNEIGFLSLAKRTSEGKERGVASEQV